MYGHCVPVQYCFKATTQSFVLCTPDKHYYSIVGRHIATTMSLSCMWEAKLTHKPLWATTYHHYCWVYANYSWWQSAFLTANAQLATHKRGRAPCFKYSSGNTACSFRVIWIEAIYPVSFQQAYRCTEQQNRDNIYYKQCVLSLIYLILSQLICFVFFVHLQGNSCHQRLWEGKKPGRRGKGGKKEKLPNLRLKQKKLSSRENSLEHTRYTMAATCSYISF